MKTGTRVRIVRASTAERMCWPADIVGANGVVIDDGDEVGGAADEPGVVHVRISHREHWYIHESDLEALS